MSLDEMLDTVSALGLEAMEIGTGGYPNNPHCALDELRCGHRRRRKHGRKNSRTREFSVATLSCHGNPVHPDAKHAAKDADTFRKTVRLAEILDVKVIVEIFGMPGRHADRFAAQLDYLPLAARVRADAGLAVERKGDSVLERGGEIRARSRSSPDRARDASRTLSFTIRER